MKLPSTSASTRPPLYAPRRAVPTLFALVVATALWALPASAQMGMGMGNNAPPPPASGDEVLPSVDPKVGADAHSTWARAEKEFADRDWLEAIAYYQHLRTKFSYNTPLVALAQLRLGDVAFERERWSEARAHYRAFLRFHPKHEQADYAAYRTGLSSYRDIPGDSWITPSQRERDQKEVREALRLMREFQARYPESRYVDEARAAETECVDLLAEHELYVAKFYAKRKKWRGTILRTRTLVDTYPESTLAPEALALQVEAHAELGEKDEAKLSLDKLVARGPGAEKYVARAREALASVK